MTLAQRIINEHTVRDNVAPGDLVTVKIDRVYLQDGNSPTIARLFKLHEFSFVFDPHKIGVFFDHSVIAPDKQIANRLREAERFVESFGLQKFRAGTGISHIVALEEGWYQPGTIVLGSDSHTCIGGVTQCLALGMGASDIAAAMVTGETWLRVPETVWLQVSGQPSRASRAKDVVLHLLSKFGQEKFLYKSVEWMGEWPQQLSLDSAATVTSMAVDMGAKCAFMPPGKGRPLELLPLNPPENGDSRRIELDVTNLPPMIARPHQPSNIVPLDACQGEKVDYVFIGSCTNSYLEDIAEVAAVFENALVHSDVYCLVTPGSKRIYRDAMRLGYIDTLLRAGAVVTPPGCSACLGTQGSIPASGDRVLTTMNRNFLGRMGNPEAEISLSSPLVAAHAAICGEFPNPDNLV